MLVLSRKREEEITINRDIKIKVLKILANRVLLGITGPDGTTIVRSELLQICTTCNAEMHRVKNNGVVEDVCPQCDGKVEVSVDKPSHETIETQ